jgi:hypothetical protein
VAWSKLLLSCTAALIKIGPDLLGQTRPGWLQDCARDRAGWVFGGGTGSDSGEHERRFAAAAA